MNAQPAEGTGGNPRGHRAGDWLRLALSLAALWFMVFVAAPLIEKIPAVDTMHTFIEERDIEAAALYYTEVEEFADAESHIRDAVAFQAE